MKRFGRDLPHYLPLLGIVTIGVLGFLIFSYDKSFQTLLIVFVAACYVAWGIIHHHLHKDLYLMVVLEYLAVAALGVVIVFSLILNT